MTSLSPFLPSSHWLVMAAHHKAASWSWRLHRIDQNWLSFAFGDTNDHWLRTWELCSLFSSLLYSLFVTSPPALALCSCLFPSLISESKGISLSQRFSIGHTDTLSLLFSQDLHGTCSLKVKCVVTEALEHGALFISDKISSQVIIICVNSFTNDWLMLQLCVDKCSVETIIWLSVWAFVWHTGGKMVQEGNAASSKYPVVQRLALEHNTLLSCCPCNLCLITIHFERGGSRSSPNDK